MNKGIFLIVLLSFLFVSNTLKSEPNLAKINSLPLLTIGKEQITYDQLERAYQKNISKQKPHLYLLEKDSLMDFLNLYSNYRLKVQDALSRGLDKDSTIKAEGNQNRRILAESYLFEKEMTEPYVNLMTERRKVEYKFAVIFTTFPQMPTRDTAAAFTRINEALAKIKSGEDFNKIAEKYCDDENLSKKGGVVDQWVTSGKISRELEDVIYTLEPGQFYPQVIATPYGYFLLKVLEKQPRYFVMGAHILYKQFLRPTDSVNVGDLAYPALEKIRKGASFEETARNESTDQYTGENGGSFQDLYSRSTGFEKSKGMLDPKFSDAMFALKDGGVSNVVTTDYGNHIIKRLYSEQLDMTKEKDEVRKIYKKQYYETDKLSFLDKVASRMNLSVNENTLSEVVKSLDTNQSNISRNWIDSIPKSILPKDLFSISGKKYSVNEFAKEMASNASLKGFATNAEGLKKSIRKFVEPMLIENATSNLENKYPDFKQLLTEFNDGILLFKVETMEVWDKLQFDSVAAKKYYEEHKKEFITEPKYDISEIYVLSDSIAQSLYKRLLNGDNFDTLATQNTQRTGYREKAGKWGVVSSISNKLGKIAAEKNTTGPILLPPVTMDNGFSIIKVNQYYEPRPKTLEEAIPDFASKIQDQKQKTLLNNWLNGLKKKFPVSINTKNVDEIMKLGKEKR